MAILMLSTKQRIINTDHIVTAYLTGTEENCSINIDLVDGGTYKVGHFKSFGAAQTALAQLAAAIIEEPSRPIEEKNGGFYR